MSAPRSLPEARTRGDSRPGCPAERSSAMVFRPSPKICRASLDWTAEGGCPHVFTFRRRTGAAVCQLPRAAPRVNSVPRERMIFSSLPAIFCRINSASEGPVSVSSSPVTIKVGTLIVFRSGTESGRSAMPRCTSATFPADIFRIMRRAPSTRSGRLSRVVCPINFGTMLSKKGSVPRSSTSAAACNRPALASGESGGALVLHSASAATRPR